MNISKKIESPVLLAVSGGADSVAMLRWFADGFAELETIAVGHVNHGLRAKESDDDALFVRELSGRLGLRYFEYRILPEEWAEDQTGSREAAARDIRYRFLVRTAEELGFRYVATAHTADDQTETVLHRILRGTGLSGLAGMAPFRQLNPAVSLIRPLLEVRRSEIIEYLHRLNQPFRTDSSNLENEFTRNRIRNHLLPAIRDEFNPKIDDALNRLARQAGETDRILDDLLANLVEQVVLSRTPERIVFDSDRLRERHPATIGRLFVALWKQNDWPLREMGFAKWSRLVDFFLNEKESGGKCMDFPGSVAAEHRSERGRKSEFILRRDAADSGA